MRRLHPLSAVPRALNAAVRAGSTVFFLLLMAGTVSDAVAFEWMFVLAPLAGLGGLAYGMARYYRFTYELADGRLSVASGVFDRQERDIPLGRIQNVDVRRGLFQRLAGLATVSFETAGGSATEAVLNAVRVEEADRLQEAVARHRRDASDRRTADRERPTGETGAQTEGATDAAATGTAAGTAGTTSAETEAAAGDALPEREVLYELSTDDLLLYGLVSVRPAGPVLTLFSAPFLEDLAWDAVAAVTAMFGGPGELSFEVLPRLSRGDLTLVVAVAAVLFLAASWALSAVLTVLGYYNFRLERVGDDLRYERGLLQRFSGSIPLEKVQTVTISENALMRPLGYAGLALETAGYAPGGNGGGGASNTAVPFDSRETVVEYAGRLGPVECPSVERPPERSRRRYAFRYGVLPVLLVTGLLAVLDRVLGAAPWWPFALAGLLAAPLAGHLAWRNRGHAVGNDGLVTRAGFWVRRTRLVPYFRVQTVIDTRTVFQRRRDLASVTADTASSASIVGGHATAFDLDDDVARGLHRTLRERLAEDLVRRKRERRERRSGTWAGGTDADAPDRDGSSVDDGDVTDDDRSDRES